MSELKAYRPYANRDGFYLKSEADKVIAELKDKCQMHGFFWEGCGFAKRGFKNTIAVSEAYDFMEAENVQLKEAVAVYQRNEKLDIRELRHQKYKRCLAMAAKYLWKRNYWRDSTPAYERQHQWENMAYKHYKRWLEIAEKFKSKAEEYK